jgi:CheY-like chemotaxis protein
MTNSDFPATKRTIMVVDDEPDVVTILRAILELNEYNVMSAYSGPELFARLEEQKPDLIILDVMMPDMDGLEVLSRLKSAPKTSSIPVILLTALNNAENILTGFKMGADHYITKPFRRTHLVTVIDHFLSGKQYHSIQSRYEDQFDNV